MRPGGGGGDPQGGDGATRRTAAAGQAMVELQANASAAAGGAAMVVGLSPLSETLWRDSKALPPGAGPAALIADVSARLTWKDLCVTVALGPGKTQTVLDELTGYAEPGSLTALMGPSGSGKSTLLDALAGRLATNAFLSGNVLLNGRKTKLSFGAAVRSELTCRPFYLHPPSASLPFRFIFESAKLDAVVLPSKNEAEKSPFYF